MTARKGHPPGEDARIAVVTGGNRGIGLAICRGLARAGCCVVLTARDGARGEAARAALAREGFETVFHPLDVDAPESIRALAEWLETTFGRLDILVNNAAVNPDRAARAETLDPAVLEAALRTNLTGPLLLCQALAPLLRRGRHPRIVNVSSGLGSLAGMGGGSAAYRISKTGLNALTRILADDLRAAGILVNCCHPGWVRTEMGGKGAAKSPEEGADTPVWLALLPDDGPTGGFFRDRKPMAW